MNGRSVEICCSAEYGPLNMRRFSARALAASVQVRFVRIAVIHAKCSDGLLPILLIGLPSPYSLQIEVEATILINRIVSPNHSEEARSL